MGICHIAALITSDFEKISYFVSLISFVKRGKWGQANRPGSRKGAFTLCFLLVKQIGNLIWRGTTQLMEDKVLIGCDKFNCKGVRRPLTPVINWMSIQTQLSWTVTFQSSQCQSSQSQQFSFWQTSLLQWFRYFLSSSKNSSGWVDFILKGRLFQDLEMNYFGLVLSVSKQ